MGFGMDYSAGSSACHRVVLKRSDTAEQEWWLSIGQGEARVALGSLLFKTLRLKGVELDNLTAGVRARIPLAADDR